MSELFAHFDEEEVDAVFGDPVLLEEILHEAHWELFIRQLHRREQIEAFFADSQALEDVFGQE